MKRKEEIVSRWILRSVLMFVLIIFTYVIVAQQGFMDVQLGPYQYEQGSYPSTQPSSTQPITQPLSYVCCAFYSPCTNFTWSPPNGLRWTKDSSTCLKCGEVQHSNKDVCGALLPPITRDLCLTDAAIAFDFCLDGCYKQPIEKRSTCFIGCVTAYDTAERKCYG
ncbi:MAG TPA: hypothetical protein VJK51_01680 [Candidatus Nanoarchaeia archaeon]|nr:hypothetical protein [Candidatus Nanoarchaeia archaeon]